MSKAGIKPRSAAPEVDPLMVQLRAPGNKPAQGKVLQADPLMAQLRAPGNKPAQGKVLQADPLMAQLRAPGNKPAQGKVLQADPLMAQLRAPGNKPAQGKVLQTYLSPLRQERVGRAGALVCLVVRSHQRRSDPPPSRRNERIPYIVMTVRSRAMTVRSRTMTVWSRTTEAPRCL